jgi:endonuclease/exonuclease/phosphatase family metal-dependent hydrolase
MDSPLGYRLNSLIKRSDRRKTKRRQKILGFAFIFLVLASGGFGKQALAKAPIENFCVQTLNMYGPIYAPDIQGRTALLAGHLAASSPCDFFHFQEFWSPAQQALLFERLQEQKLPLVTLLADDVRHDRFRTGLLTLSQHPVETVESQLFEKNTASLSDVIRKKLYIAKGFLAVATPSVVHVNLHLHHHSQKIRIAQLLELADFLAHTESLRNAQNQERAVILAGDFNFEPTSLEYGFVTSVLGFSDAFEKVHSAGFCTHCRKNKYSFAIKSRWIDYIFFRSSPSFRLNVSAAAITFAGDDRGPLVSDHFGLKASFSLEQQPLCEAVLQSVLPRTEQAGLSSSP